MELYLTLVHHSTTACVITMDIPILGDILGAPAALLLRGPVPRYRYGNPPLSAVNQMDLYCVYLGT